MKLSNGPLGVFPTWRATGVVRCCLLFVLTILPLGALDATGAPCVFVRGDIWGTAPGELAVLDFNDASYLLSFLDNTAPLNAERPECVDAGDVNDNGLVELSDVAYLINYVVNGGPAPPPPTPAAPGVDTTPDLAPELTAPDPRFEFSIGTAIGAAIPDDIGISIPVTMSNLVPITAFTMVITFSTEQLRVFQVDINENNVLTQSDGGGGGPDYVIADERSSHGVAVITAIIDFSDPWAFHNGIHGLAIDPEFPATPDHQTPHAVATLQVGIVTGADQGFAPLTFTDGIVIPPYQPFPVLPIHESPAVDNLVMLGGTTLRPVLNAGGGIDIRRGFVRGDVNKDDGVDLSDPIYLLDWIFRGMTPPPCLEAANANNDRIIDVSDAIWLLSFLFRGGPAPSEPYPNAGLDPSETGTLGCEAD